MAAFTLLHRFTVTPANVEAVRLHCEKTEDYIWVGSKGSNNANHQRLRRYTLRGVPANQIDLAIYDGPHDGRLVCCEIGEKVGRFDGAKRTQLTLRYWAAGERQPLARGQLNLAVEDQCPVEVDHTQASEMGEWAVLSAAWFARTVVQPACSVYSCEVRHIVDKPERRVEITGGSWISAYRMLRSTLDTYDLRAVVIWQWRHYYQTPLTWEEASSVADEFDLTCPRTHSLAEGNRLASRMLYDAARRAGWHKLTLRERKRHGLGSFSGQWISEAAYNQARGIVGAGTSSGCGDYTIRAAYAQAEREADILGR